MPYYFFKLFLPQFRPRLYRDVQPCEENLYFLHTNSTNIFCPLTILIPGVIHYFNNPVNCAAGAWHKYSVIAIVNTVFGFVIEKGNPNTLRISYSNAIYSSEFNYFDDLLLQLSCQLRRRRIA